jgi:hypothetical protein
VAAWASVAEEGVVETRAAETGAAKTRAAETGAAAGDGGSVDSIERLGRQMEFTPLAEMLTPDADVDTA